MNPETDYVVLPETALTNTGWVEDYGRNLVFQHWFEKTSPYPNVKLISGAVAYESISDVTKIPHYEKIPGIRFSEKYQRWYRTYNAAIQLERGQMPQIRAKEGLVPFQEYAPYPHLLPRIAPVGIFFHFSPYSTFYTLKIIFNPFSHILLFCQSHYGIIFNFSF